MSATTKLLDLFRDQRELTSDNAAAIALGVHRATVSGWRQRGTQAEPHVIAKMAAAINQDAGGWLALVESERARSDDDRKAWVAVARRLGAAAALFLAVALPISEAHASVAEQQHAGGIMRSVLRWLRAALSPYRVRGERDDLSTTAVLA